MLISSFVDKCIDQSFHSSTVVMICDEVSMKGHVGRKERRQL